ncbi:MAG: hypothetical protein JXR96_12985 [Deltaproteobacteria bacterium]|nr:hypothetical protein [Deltaproteobacteria bacterium]
MTSKPIWKRGAFTDSLLACAVLAAGALVARPGVFSVDESHYLLGCQSMAEHASFRIDNGYEQVPDPALLFFYTVVPDDLDALGTVSTVPPLHAVVAAPFFGALGLRGLVLLNLLAFALCLVAVRHMAERLRAADPRFVHPLVACAVFGLASYSAEYALGIWPHALSQALIAWALLLLIKTGDGGARTWTWALLAGVVGGVACGVRLQNIVLFPLALALARTVLRHDGRSLAAQAAGWMVPVAIMGLINHSRLGTWNPFTYGAASSYSGPLGQLLRLSFEHAYLTVLVLICLAGSVYLWMRTRRKVVWLGLAAAGLLAAFALPAGRAMLAHWLRHAGYHLVDTSLGSGLVSAGAHFNELGQTLYGGVLKKSLIESIPVLVVCPLALLPMCRQAKQPMGVRFLALTGLAGLLVLPFVISTGGWCHNPRYFLELLPALVLVALWVAREQIRGRVLLLTGIGLGLLCAAPVLLHPGSVDSPAGGWLPALLPLCVSAALIGTMILARLAPAVRGLALSMAGCLFTSGVIYACALHLGVDVPRSLAVRSLGTRMVAEALHVLPANEDSVLTAAGARADALCPLKLERRVWIARLEPGASALPLLDRAPRDRRLFVLANGVPLELLRARLAGGALDRQERKGLVFLELAH